MLGEIKPKGPKGRKLNCKDIKWAGSKAEPLKGSQAAEVNFVGASEASGGPCEELCFGRKR
jgi:hypothetical protein